MTLEALTDAELQRTLDVYADASLTTVTAVAKALGITRAGVYERLRICKRRGMAVPKRIVRRAVVSVEVSRG